MDGIRTVGHRQRWVFQLHRQPKSSTSGERNRDSLLDSIRSPRFIVSSRFILHRANYFDNSCCVKRVRVVEHIAFRLSVYRIFGR